MHLEPECQFENDLNETRAEKKRSLLKVAHILDISVLYQKYSNKEKGSISCRKTTRLYNNSENIGKCKNYRVYS